MDLSIVYKFIEEMNSSTSSNDKIELIRFSHPLVRKVLFYTYNTFQQYNITPKLLNKRPDLCNEHTNFKSVFELLDSLNNRMITGHKAITETNSYIFKNPDAKDLLYLILERNLKVRASIKLINKALPKFIPEFNVALANKYDEKTKKKVDLENDDWNASRKLDGVRCLIVVNEKGKANSFSRAGKQFHTLTLIEKEIESLGVKNVVFDGEMCIVNEDGDEDFQNVMKEIGRKDHVIQNGLFQMFDFIPLEIFNAGVSTDSLFSHRHCSLKVVLSYHKDLKYIKILNQIPIFNFDELERYIQKASDKNWEGVMIRKDDQYKGKRSNDILKVKTFHDDEYKVKEIITGPFRYVKEGIEVEEEMLSAVLIEHKGHDVRVGSGFTIDQRKHLFSKPEDILNKIITVQYFEESQNQEGGLSLRFPTIKVIHGEERNT